MYCLATIDKKADWNQKQTPHNISQKEKDDYNIIGDFGEWGT